MVPTSLPPPEFVWDSSVHGRLSTRTTDGTAVRFYIVLSLARNGSWGFVKDSLRLNVALSRSKDPFIFVCDMAASKSRESCQQKLNDLDEEGREMRMTAERRICQTFARRVGLL